MTILQIDRTKPFDPVAFIGVGWSIVKQDKRSLALTEVDVTKLSLQLKRRKDTGHIRLDAQVFKTLWYNQSLIPASWKELTNGKITYTHFDGTILRSSTGKSFLLFFCWVDGEWHWDCNFISSRRQWANEPFAVLAS